ncbi:hypothetical protein JCM8208_002505 [Rhodotorula glutinis]
MAALTKWLSREDHDLLDLFDAAAYVPKRQRQPPPPPPPLQPAPAVALGSHKRTASTASRRSIASIVHDRLMGQAASQRPSRAASIRSQASVVPLPPLLSLPSELLLYILELALPSTHTRATARERSATLARIALVHPVLRAYAQGELFSTVFVTSDDVVARLTRSTCVPKSRGNALGKQIRTLRVTGDLQAGDGNKALEALVDQLKGLDTLSLEDLDGLELRNFAIHPSLRHLSATRCGFRSRFRSFEARKASHLRSLALTNCTAQHDAFAGFTTPDLVKLRVWDMSLPPPTPMATVEESEACRTLAHEAASRLEDVACDFQHLAYLFPPPRHHPPLFRRTAPVALRHLTLVKLSSLSRALETLPAAAASTLSTLLLVPTPSFLPHCTSPDRAEAHFAALVAPFQPGGATAAVAPGNASVHAALASLRTLRLDWRYTAWLAAPPALPTAPLAGRALLFGGGGPGTGPQPPPPSPAESAALAHALGHAHLVRLVERCSALEIDVRFDSLEGEGAGGADDVYGSSSPPMSEASTSYLPPPTPPPERASSPPPPHHRPGASPPTTTASPLEATAPTLGQSLSSSRAHRQRRVDLQAPPTPLALPGGWSGLPTRPARVQRSNSEGDGLRWRLQHRSSTDDEQEVDSDSDDQALLLPPPFLADDSPRETFDGLLGTRRARSLSKQQRAHDRLFAHGRAPPASFPGGLVTAVIKVARVLGPPGGYDAPRSRAQVGEGEGKGKGRERAKGLSLDEAAQRLEESFGHGSRAGRQGREGAGKFEERQRRRLRRAESGLRAYELGTEVGRRVAGRLERHRSRRDAVDVDAQAVDASTSIAADEQVLAAVTPAALLGSPPIIPFLASPLAQHQQHGYGRDDDLPLDLPSAPPLRPTTNPNLPPFPTISTPLALEPAALDDYFGLLWRTSSRRASLASTSPRQRSAFLPSASSPRTPFVLRAVPTREETIPRRLLDVVIFLLIGSPPRPSSAGLDTSFASVGGILGAVVHAVGFLFFVAYHLSTLVVASLVALRRTTTFLYWVGMNLSGRTEVARAVVEYWRACRAEWDRVVDEDGEERIGLWSVGQGLAELAVLQSMTHLKWLREGPGRLVLLNGGGVDDKRLATPRLGPQRRKRSLVPDRPTITKRQQSYRWTGDGDEEDGAGLVVTSRRDGVLVGTLISHGEPDSSAPQGLDALVASSSDVDAATPIEPRHDDPPPLDLDGPDHLPSSPPLPPVRDDRDPLVDLVSLIKRTCRLSTASYGLHTIIPSPPTPLLTPSGKTLPQRVFAHLGGVPDHQDVLHVAIQKRYTGLPSAAGDGEDEASSYSPAMFLLRDDVRGEIIVVFRGTQSLADLRTDLDSSLVSLDLPDLPSSTSPETKLASALDSTSPTTTSTPYRIHSGILSTAQHLLAPSPSSTTPSPLLPSLRATLAAHPRYALVLTGHSLGAALASTVALLLGAWDAESCAWVVRPDAGLDGEGVDVRWRRPLRAVCFAHPTTLNAPLAARCAFPSPTDAARLSANNDFVPLVINVSLGADVICRMGIPHVRDVRRVVGRLDRARRSVRGGQGVLGAWRAWRKAMGSGDEDEVRRLEEWAWTARASAEGWASERDAKEEDEVEAAVPAGRAYHLDRLPPALEQRRREELDGEEVDDDEHELWGLYEVGDPRRFFQLPLLRSDLLAHHMPQLYGDVCDSL